MKKLLLFGFVFLVTLVQAKKVIVPGKIYYERDSTDVSFEVHTNWEDNVFVESVQTGIKYVDADGKSRFLKPEMAKGISFTYAQIRYLMVSIQNTIGLGPIIGKIEPYLFLKVEYGGDKLKLLLFHRSTVQSHIMVFVLAKKNGSTMPSNTYSFRKTYTTFFSDCPNLSQRIQRKELRRKDFYRIIDIYNSECP